MVKNNNFWIVYSMHGRYCTYRYKNDKICNSKIHIQCCDDKGKWKCYDHVSKVVYKSEKKRKAMQKFKMEKH